MRGEVVPSVMGWGAVGLSLPATTYDGGSVRDCDAFCDLACDGPYLIS